MKDHHGNLDAADNTIYAFQLILGHFLNGILKGKIS
jgi:hypothetical protein